jgi:hypothetical protein
MEVAMNTPPDEIKEQMIRNMLQAIDVRLEQAKEQETYDEIRVELLWMGHHRFSCAQTTGGTSGG